MLKWARKKEKKQKTTYKVPLYFIYSARITIARVNQLMKMSKSKVQVSDLQYYYSVNVTFLHKSIKEKLKYEIPF